MMNIEALVEAAEQEHLACACGGLEGHLRVRGLSLKNADVQQVFLERKIPEPCPRCGYPTTPCWHPEGKVGAPHCSHCLYHDPEVHR